jgi:hypothetical protein
MLQKLKLGVNKEVVELSISWVEGIRIQYCARYAMLPPFCSEMQMIPYLSMNGMLGRIEYSMHTMEELPLSWT